MQCSFLLLKTTKILDKTISIQCIYTRVRITITTIMRHISTIVSIVAPILQS